MYTCINMYICIYIKYVCVCVYIYIYIHTIYIYIFPFPPLAEIFFRLCHSYIASWSKDGDLQ